MKPWRHYLQILLPLLVVFAVYQWLFVPWLEPLPRESNNTWVRERHQARGDLRWWEHYFMEGSWQRNNPLVIERDQCILLYQEREQISDTRWRFRPLTIVIPQEDAASGKRAIFIENPKGAEIQFKSAFDWTTGHPPPVVNGLLLGDIKIYSPGDESSNRGELLVETRDMRIDKRQIWTTEPIKMQLGNSYIEGRYLSIYMDRDLLSERSTTESVDSSPFSGLDYLELFYVDRVDLALRPGGLWPSGRNPGAEKKPAHASLQCGGTFVFQFHQSQATLKNGVHMEHRVEGMPVDTFDCNELKLTMSRTDAKSETPKDPEKGESQAWRIDRLEATGTPGRDMADHANWIRMSAPGMHAEAHGQHLVMDFVHGMVTLSNALLGAAPRNSSRVFLKRESFQVSSPHIQFQNPDLIRPDGNQTMRRLGWVVAEGIGQAQLETPDDSWSLRWSQRLVIRPHEQRDLIMIEGGANISSLQRGRFIAETLNMWVLPVGEELATRLAPYYPENELPEFVPDSISAQGDVMVATAELNAQVESMVVRFRYPQASELRPAPSVQPPPGALASASHALVAGPDRGQEASGNSLNLSPAAPRLGPPSPSSIGAPQENGAMTPQLTSPVARTLKSNPITATGKLLHAEILRVGKESTVDALSIDGNFTLTRNRLTEDSQLPLTVTGDRLILRSESEDVTNIHMVGQPAKISVGSGWVVAPELQLSQTDQMFWIDHPGEMVIPTEALKKQAAEAANPLMKGPSLLGAASSNASRADQASDDIVWQSAPRIQWGERMTFDGRIARFGGGVTLDARMQTSPDTLWHVMGSASTMTLDLVDRIPLRFQNGKTNSAPTSRAATQPELQVVRLDGDVDIKAVQTDLLGNRRSTENLLVPRIELNVPSQTWLGFGPGQLWSRRFGNTNPMASPSVAASIPGNRGASLGVGNANASESLQCLHLTFLGRVEGSMQQRLVSFYDKIDALLGPIASWNDSIDVRKSETLGANQTRLLCDQLNLFDASELSYQQAQPGTRNAAWEIDALGNAQLASRTDSGDVVIDANRLGYAALEDSVRMEGTSRRGATIRRLPLNGSPGQSDEIQVSSATMRLKTGQLDAQIRRVEGALPPQLQRPIDSVTPRNGPTNPAAPPSAPALPSPRDFQPVPSRPGRP